METLRFIYNHLLEIYEENYRHWENCQRYTRGQLYFRKATKEQQIFDNSGVIKRIEAEGTGELIKEIKVPCSIYLSFYKYDYEGRFYSQLLNVCIRDINKRSSLEIPQGVYLAV